jgi:hypothetical protein
MAVAFLRGREGQKTGELADLAPALKAPHTIPAATALQPVT